MVSILLVDDDVRDVELALAALKKAAPEAQIDVASSGEEAVEYLRRHGDRQGGCPDLVVLDLPNVTPFGVGVTAANH